MQPEQMVGGGGDTELDRVGVRSMRERGCGYHMRIHIGDLLIAELDYSRKMKMPVYV
jgi:hypothetical protein